MGKVWRTDEYRLLTTPSAPAVILEDVSPIDLPERWPPVAGVDLATYARVTAMLLTRGVTGPDVGELTTAYGISPATWAQARQEWMRRIGSDPEVREAYGDLYRAMRR